MTMEPAFTNTMESFSSDSSETPTVKKRGRRPTLSNKIEEIAIEVEKKETVDSENKNTSKQGKKDSSNSSEKEFEISGPREDIRIVGVGGGGGNALNHMVRNNVSGVKFIAANTDLGALSLSGAGSKIVLGEKTAKGLGAGANPEVGEQSAKESSEALRNSVKNADMVFVTAGMGGGTGTGAAPIIAELAREEGALVVGVVTKPFFFEMGRRNKYALEGIEKLRKETDALIVIENDRLLEIGSDNMKQTEAFAMVDNVLCQAVKGVVDLVLETGLVNVDFADIRTVMKNSGSAIMGTGEGEGEKRAEIAAKNAIQSPLMTRSMKGASGVLFNISGGENLLISEIRKAAEIITADADPDANVIWGHTVNQSLGEKVRITVIATGFPENDKNEKEERKKNEFSMTPKSETVVETSARRDPGRFAMNQPMVASKTKTPEYLEESDYIRHEPAPPKNRFDVPSILKRNGGKSSDSSSSW